MATKIENRYKVRFIEQKPLPSGRTVQLFGFAEWIEDDGRVSVRVITPGLYCGGIYKLSASEFEAV